MATLGSAIGQVAAGVPGAPASAWVFAGSFAKAFPLLLFLVGAILNTVAYWSMAPVVVFLISIASVLGLMRVFDGKGREERRAVLLVFVICFFWAGVSASFLDIFGEESQDPDSTYFHELVNDRQVNPIEDAIDVRPEDDNISIWRIAYDVFAVTLLQNAGAILAWRVVYDFFSFLGLGTGRYVGITLNIALVALSAMMGVKIVRSIFGDDPTRIRRFTLIFSCCGMFWLFASLHLRDSMALLCVTSLTLFWTNYLVAPGRKTFVVLCVASIVALLLFGLVRTEFFFVPFAMLLAGVVAKTVGKRRPDEGQTWPYVALWSVVACVIVGGLIAFPQTINTVGTILASREKLYSEISAYQQGEGSLGNTLIVSQPGPVRLLFSSVYIFINPIPFWGGIASTSAYHMYKSFHVIFMYFAFPLFVLALWRLAQHRARQTPAVLFIAFSFVGFTLGIAYTSLEARHLGAFLVLFMVLAVLPDLKSLEDRKGYRLMLTAFLGFIVPMHLTWIVYKLVT